MAELDLRDGGFIGVQGRGRFLKDAIALGTSDALRSRGTMPSARAIYRVQRVDIVFTTHLLVQVVHAIIARNL